MALLRIVKNVYIIQFQICKLDVTPKYQPHIYHLIKFTQISQKKWMTSLLWSCVYTEEGVENLPSL